jgi:hypothetical protein
LPSQQLQGQLQKQHSADTISTAWINNITEKENHKDNSLKASFGNITVEQLLFLPYTTKKSIKLITRKIIPMNNKAILRKTTKFIIVIVIECN